MGCEEAIVPTRQAVRIFIGIWAAAMLPLVARGGQPPRVATTQRATVAPAAFAATDPVMANPTAAKTLSATMVSAELKNIRRWQAFRGVEQAIGLQDRTVRGGQQGQIRGANVTATIVNQPFWAAMREVCTRGNVSLYYYGDEGADRIPIMPGTTATRG
jgi:hypothetical protein